MSRKQRRIEADVLQLQLMGPRGAEILSAQYRVKDTREAAHALRTMADALDALNAAAPEADSV